MTLAEGAHSARSSCGRATSRTALSEACLRSLEWRRMADVDGLGRPPGR